MNEKYKKYFADEVREMINSSDCHKGYLTKTYIYLIDNESTYLGYKVDCYRKLIDPIEACKTCTKIYDTSTFHIIYPYSEYGYADKLRKIVLERCKRNWYNYSFFSDYDEKEYKQLCHTPKRKPLKIENVEQQIKNNKSIIETMLDKKEEEEIDDVPF